MLKSKIKWANFILILLLLFSILFSGCITDSNIKKSNQNVELFIGTLGDSSGYFPWIQIRDTSTLTINVNIFNSLIQIDKHDLGFIPALAENWYNPDNVTWRFFLRRDVKFHNGYIFTAEDVKFTLDYIKNFSYFGEELQSISEINIVDNYTVDIITKNPYPNLLNKMLTVYMISKQYTIETNFSNESWPIGTGAYKLLEDSPGKQIILERFDDYWKEKPDVKKVIFKKMNNSEELKDALISGDLDIIQISLEAAQEISNIKGLKVASVKPPAVVYLSFDFRVNNSVGFPNIKNPVSDVRVRKAIYHAINVSSMIEKYKNGSAEPESQFITIHLFGFNPNIQRLPYDIDLAKQYMKDAGYEQGFNITFDSPESDLAINLTNEIVKQLSKINITVIPNFLPSADYYMNLYLKNTSFYITSFNSYDAESTLILLIQTSNIEENIGIWNYGNYSNPYVDNLIENLTFTMDMTERKRIIQEAFAIAADDVAWIPLYSSIVFYGLRDDIEWNPRPSLFIWVEEIYFE